MRALKAHIKEQKDEIAVCIFHKVIIIIMLLSSRVRDEACEVGTYANLNRRYIRIVFVSVAQEVFFLCVFLCFVCCFVCHHNFNGNDV